MDFREDLKAYIDGELSESRSAEIREALAADAKLREEYEELLAIGLSLQKVVLPRVHGLETTLQALTPRKRSTFRIAGPWWFGLGLTGAAALVMALNLLSRHSLIATESGQVAMRNKAQNFPSGPAVSSNAQDEVAQVPVAPASKDRKLSAKSVRPSPVRTKPPVKAPAAKPRHPKLAQQAAPNLKAGMTAPGEKVTLESSQKSQGNPNLVVIEVDSVPAAEEAIEELVRDNAGQRLMRQSQQFASQSQAPPVNSDRSEMDVEVPADKVDAVKQKLKLLPKSLTHRDTNEPTAKLGSGGFGGNAQLGGPAGGAIRGANADQNRSIQTGKYTKLTIIVIKRKPVYGPPKEPDSQD